MNFSMPEGLDSLSIDELNALLENARTEATDIAAIPDDELTDEQIADLTALSEAITGINAQVETAQTAAAERAAKIAELKAAVAVPEAPDEDDPEEAGEDTQEIETTEEGDADTADTPADKDTTEEAPADSQEDEATADEQPLPDDVVIPDDAAELIENQEEESNVNARKSVAQVAANAAPAEEAIPAERPMATVVASADVPGFNSGQELGNMDAIVDAFLNRARGFGGKSKGLDRGAYGLSKNAKRVSVAQVQKPENEFTTGADESAEKQMEMVFAAAKESRLPGGSLVAAGGWCAPSEIWYDSFLELETSEGMLDIPEVTARRGGIQFTKGPQLSDLLGDASFGFVQTEAEAEAGTEKNCYALECPDFEEIRLDAVGFCLTAGVLTNKAYPELVRRVLTLARLAHRRKMNATKIAKISTMAGTAVDYAEIGAAASDVLDALVIQALRLRYLYSMAENATIEVVLPLWAKEIFRSDLSRRNGVDLLAVTDAQIATYFSVRGLRVQYVYDYQPFDTTATGAWTHLPETLEAIMYPAGAYVALTTDVVDFDAIYDSVGLSTNTYTAAFFEEGLAIANTGGEGVKVSIDINVFGNTGAANIPVAP